MIIKNETGKTRISIKEALRWLNELKKTKYIVMQTNSWNPYVIRTLVYDKNEDTTPEIYWLEGLTKNTESMLLTVANEKKCGRFW